MYQLAVLTVAPGDPPSATVLVSVSDLSQFSFYQRGSVAEFMTFMSKTVSERTQPTQRQSVQENNYTAHCYNRGDLSGASDLLFKCPWHKKTEQADGLWSSAAVAITDHEYPVRVAFSVLNKILDEFSTSVPADSYSKPSSISFPALATYLQQYQDPRQADNIMRVQQELDETKIILVSLYLYSLCLNKAVD